MIIKQESYKVGDKVMIVELEALRKCHDCPTDMWENAGKIFTIASLNDINAFGKGTYKLKDAGYSWYPDMIAGRVIDIVLHDGKAYRPVARKAQVGELVQIVKMGSHVPCLVVGDIHKAVSVSEWGVKTDYDNYFALSETHEYLTLEPIPCMTDEPHPEIAEGSTFVVARADHCLEEIKAGDIVTLAKNDDSNSPLFDQDRKWLLWSRLAPINIIYKQDKIKDRITVEELREAKKTFDTQGHTPWSIPDEKLKQPAAMTDEPHPEIKPGAQFRVVDAGELGYAKVGDIVTLHSNFDNSKSASFIVKRTGETHGIFWRRLVPIDTCQKQCASCKFSESCEYGLMDCRHYEPVKRAYTPEQIAEARDIVYRIMTEPNRRDVAYRFFANSKKTGVRMIVNNGNKTWVEKSVQWATCSDRDEFQPDIGRMVALCKLTGEKMPAWLEATT